MDWSTWLPATRSDITALTGKLSALLVAAERLEEVIVASKQETIDALTASVQTASTAVGEAVGRANTALDGVKQDLADLKAAGTTDTFALEASVATLSGAVAPLTALADSLGAVDAENPEMPPVDPTDPTDPGTVPDPELPAPPVDDPEPVDPNV